MQPGLSNPFLSSSYVHELGLVRFLNSFLTNSDIVQNSSNITWFTKENSHPAPYLSALFPLWLLLHLLAVYLNDCSIFLSDILILLVTDFSILDLICSFSTLMRI